MTPSLINLMVSVDVKHRDYLLTTYRQMLVNSRLGWGKRDGGGGGGGERETEKVQRQHSKTLIYKDCSLGSVKVQFRFSQNN